MNAASHVPSGVLISTFVSVTCCCAARSLPAAATIPAATVVTKSRRVSSSFSIVVVLPRREEYYPGPMRRQSVRELVFVATALAFAPVHATSLSCLRPVSGVTWLRWDEERPILDAWCESVGPPVFAPGTERSGAVSRLRVVSWNVHVGGGDLEELMSE